MCHSVPASLLWNKCGYFTKGVFIYGVKYELWSVKNINIRIKSHVNKHLIFLLETHIYPINDNLTPSLRCV